MMEYQVYVIGALSIDEVTTSSRELRKVGGAVTYSSLSYKRLGVPTKIVSNFDIEDSLIVDKLADLEIPFHGARGESTTSFAIHVKGDGRDMKLLSKSERIEVRDLAPLCVGGKSSGAHIHLGPLFGDDIDIESIKYLKEKGFRLCIDIQGFVREIQGDSIVIAAHPKISEVLSLCSYLKADVDELQCLLDHLEIENAKGLVSDFKIQELVVTDASKGGQVYTLDGWSVIYEPDQPELADDSTGAGDVFFATYLCNRLRDHKTIEESCKLAQETVIEHLKGNHIRQSSLILASKN